PDLVELQRSSLTVELRVPNPGSGTDDLHIAGGSRSLAACVVPMRDHALAYVGDDLDIAVAVHWEAGPRRNLIVVPHDQWPKWQMSRVARRLDNEVVARLEPPEVV